MRVLLLHYASPPIVGGVESVLARQATYLTKAGHHVEVLTGRGETWDPRIPVHLIPLLDSLHPEVLRLKKVLDGGTVPPEFEGLVSEISNALHPFFANSDALIAHNVGSLHKNLALTVALFRFAQQKIPPRFILWHHDFAWTAARYQKELYPRWPWDLLRKAWPGTIQVVVSEARRAEWSDLCGLPLRAIHVIPAGIEQGEFLGLSRDSRTIFDRLQLHRFAPILLCPVRITRRKNLEQALHIMASLRAKMPDAQLIITGPPGAHNPENQAYFGELLLLRKELNLEQHVHFLAEYFPNGVEDVVVADLYRLADGLLLTSREEGFGIPVLEAGMSRMPIFCTDLAPLRAIAQENAIYFSPDAPADEVAEKIVQRLETDPLYRLRCRVRMNFSWEAIYHQKIAPILEGELS